MTFTELSLRDNDALGSLLLIGGLNLFARSSMLGLCCTHGKSGLVGLGLEVCGLFAGCDTEGVEADAAAVCAAEVCELGFRSLAWGEA